LVKNSFSGKIYRPMVSTG
jgi:hypothetical protein